MNKKFEQLTDEELIARSVTIKKSIRAAQADRDEIMAELKDRGIERKFSSMPEADKQQFAKYIGAGSVVVTPTPAVLTVRSSEPATKKESVINKLKKLVKRD